MTEYLLDTNHVSPLVTLGHPLHDKISARLQAGDIFSIIFPALHEFLFGISILPRAKQNLQKWRQLKGLFKYYDLDEVLIEKSVELRVLLRRQGWQLELVDSLIAVTAFQNDLVLLTTDKDFQVVPKLRHENWR